MLFRSGKGGEEWREKEGKKRITKYMEKTSKKAHINGTHTQQNTGMYVFSDP